MNGHNDKFRTVIRRVLRNGIGLSQERAQVWAQKADYWVHYTVMVGTCKAVMKGKWQGAALGGLAMVADYRGTYRAVRYKFDHGQIKETLGGLMKDFLKSKLKNSLKWEEKFPGKKWLWEVQ
jgi:hypothetical protein